MPLFWGLHDGANLPEYCLVLRADPRPGYSRTASIGRKTPIALKCDTRGRSAPPRRGRAPARIARTARHGGQRGKEVRFHGPESGRFTHSDSASKAWVAVSEPADAGGSAVTPRPLSFRRHTESVFFDHRAYLTASQSRERFNDIERGSTPRSFNP